MFVFRVLPASPPPPSRYTPLSLSSLFLIISEETASQARLTRGNGGGYNTAVGRSDVDGARRTLD